jgi:hypothetical protein
MKYLAIFCSLFALSVQGQININYALSGNSANTANVNTKLLTFDAAIPSEQDFGTLTNGATASFSKATNCYVLNASGLSLTFDLPANPSGAFRIDGVMTNSSGLNQVVRLTVAGIQTSLVRQGLSTNSISASSFTNIAKAYTRFAFFSSKGNWTDFIVIGDGL